MRLGLRQRGAFRKRVEAGQPWLEAVVRERDAGGDALQTEAAAELLEQDDETIRAALFAALAASEIKQSVTERLVGVTTLGGDDWLAQATASELLSGLARRKLAYTTEDVRLLFALADSARHPWTKYDRLRVAVTAAEHLANDGDADSVERDVSRALEQVERQTYDGWESERTRLLARLRKLAKTSAGVDVISKGDNWGRAARKAVNAHRSDAGELLLHLSQATSGTTPSAKWAKRARELIAETEDGEDLVRKLLELAVTVPDGSRAFFGERAYQYVVDENAVLLRGLVWAAGVLGSEWVPDVVARVAEHAGSPFEAGYEERSMKVANAAIRQLGALESEEALAALSQLRGRIKHRSIRKQIETALADAAERAGMSKAQLVERQVPTFGLDGDGSKEIRVGEATAIVRVQGEKAELTWRTSKGRAVKSVPKEVKEQHPEELKGLRGEVKELKKALSAQRIRLEELFAQEREWPYDEWRSLYRDHPLVGDLARRLIWRFDGEAALGADAPKAETVTLWRPIDVPAEEVAAWRARVLDEELVQPFKQAFREVYHLAPAERETETYSNRFAAHIVRYTQAYAVMKARGWAVSALGPWDYGDEGGRSRREFEEAEIVAEFWMDYVESDREDELIANLASTDQVRFLPAGRDYPMPLAEVPGGVFSETMRDVDLFVSVSSIAADPNWLDQGRERFNRYWYDASFGELTETAATRREVLETIVPQLRIADRCELGEKFLVVHGDLRVYKIHLGSANVLMEPNDEYLCIVPARGSKAKGVFLPFEDDVRLSEILSKAFLLADDTNITDRTITRQIGRRGLR
jgi:Domain of unknown function (DUF4132)